MKKQLFAVLARTSIGAIAIATAMPALAHPADDSAATAAVKIAPDQAPPAQDDKKDTDIVVTGSQIRNVTPAGTTLVTTTAAEIQAQGATNGNEILANIPQAANMFQQLPSVAGGTAVNIAVSILPFESVSLRHLPNVNTGAGEFTLQLLDGHRIVPVGTDATGGQGVDPAAIPASAIRQVDVEPDGGSAIYGSNAVAGVINYITKDSFDGLELSARGGLASGTYKQFDGSITAGTKWSTGSIFGSVSYSYHDALFGYMTDYIHANDANPSSPLFGTALGLNCVNPNIAITTANSRRLYPLTAPGGTIQPYTTNNGINGNGGASASTPNGVAGGNRCESSTDYNSYFPKVSAVNAVFGLKQEITPNLTFTLKGNWEKSDTQAYQPATLTATNIKPSTPGYRPVCNEPVVAPAVQPAGAICGVTPGFLAGDSTATQTIFTNYATVLGNTTSDWVHEQLWQVTPELTWNFAKDWQLRALLSYGESKTSGVEGAIGAAAATEIASGIINPYNLPASAAGAFTNLVQYTDEIGAFHILDIKGVADGPVPFLTLPGGQVHAALGAEYFRTGLTQWAPGATSPSPTSFVLPTPLSYVQTVVSGFGELAIPLVSEDMHIPLISSLNVSLSGRYDSYNDSGDSFNWLGGVTWAPISWAKIHGNYSTSFAAPSAITELTAFYGAELNNSTTNNAAINPSAPLPYFVGFIPPGGFNGGQSPAGLTAAQIAALGATAQSGTGGVPIGIEATLSAGTAPGTGPQTSRTWSIGGEISPPFVPGLTLGASYYDLRISNAIASPLQPSVQSVFNFHPELIYCSGGTTGASANAGANCAVPLSLSELTAGGYTVARTAGSGGLVTASSLTNPGQGSVGSGTSITWTQVLANYCNPTGAVSFANHNCPAGSFSVFNVVDNRTRNLGFIFSTGVDFHAGYHTNVPWGSVDLNATGTINLSTMSQASANIAAVDNQATGFSKWRVSATAGTTWGGFRAQVNWQHAAGYVLAATSVGLVGTSAVPGSGAYGQLAVNAYDTFDLFFRYKFDSWADKNGLFKGLTVTLNVNNFLNNDPPIQGGGYANGTTLGRQWLLGITKDFK